MRTGIKQSVAALVSRLDEYEGAAVHLDGSPGLTVLDGTWSRDDENTFVLESLSPREIRRWLWERRNLLPRGKSVLWGVRLEGASSIMIGVSLLKEEPCQVS